MAATIKDDKLRARISLATKISCCVAIAKDNDRFKSIMQKQFRNKVIVFSLKFYGAKLQQSVAKAVEEMIADLGEGECCFEQLQTNVLFKFT